MPSQVQHGSQVKYSETVEQVYSWSALFGSNTALLTALLVLDLLDKSQ